MLYRGVSGTKSDYCYPVDIPIEVKTEVSLLPQFRNIIPCEVLFYIEVTFWALSIDLGIFRSSWFLHRHKIPHPNQWGSMITTKKYSLFYEDFSVVGFICI